MALFHVLAPFVCGKIFEKRRVDQHKRMQLILVPHWLLSPSSAHHCSRPYHCRPMIIPFGPLWTGFSKRSTRVRCHCSVVHGMWERCTDSFKQSRIATLLRVQCQSGEVAHPPKGHLRRQYSTNSIRVPMKTTATRIRPRLTVPPHCSSSCHPGPRVSSLL